MENIKVRGTVNKRVERYEVTLIYRGHFMMQRESGRMPCTTEKERKLSLILTQKAENFEYLIWKFLKFDPQRIKCNEASD